MQDVGRDSLPIIKPSCEGALQQKMHLSETHRQQDTTDLRTHVLSAVKSELGYSDPVGAFKVCEIFKEWF